MTKFLRALVSRPVIALLAAAAALLLAGEWRAHLELVESSDARPARPTRAMRSWTLVPVEATVQAPAIPPAELPGVRRRWNRPDLVAPTRQEPAGQAQATRRPDLRAESVEPVGAQPGARVEPFSGQVQREGALLLVEAEDKRPGPAGYRMGCFLEVDGTTTVAGDPLDQKLIGFPLRWRAWASYELGAADPDFEAGLGFRALRVGRVELAPAVAAGRHGGASEVSVRAVAWFDF
jgi:hypothetical protein